MKAAIVALLAATFAVGAWAQDTRPDANSDVKQHTQRGGKDAAQSQVERTPAGAQQKPHGKRKSKRLTNDEGQQVMQNLQKSAKDEYRPPFPAPR